MGSRDARGSKALLALHSSCPTLLSAVLLAGGESKRMGADKATLLLQGKPLWRYQIELLQSLAPSEILVSARTDPDWRPAHTNFVPDTVPSCGPLSGLTAAMGAIRGTHLLVLAVDMPFLTTAILKRMYGLVTLGCGVLPRIGSRAESVAAIYPRESFPKFSAALRSGELSLQRITNELVHAGLLAEMNVPEAEQSCYRSLNHPADLVHAIQRHPRGIKQLLDWKVVQ
ncbi:MAG TPA: molybdenum cofactor guanylyltransferase [Chthoniobacterales bacterium]|nr:molybdenum cofactor guanylyltransferase [Chthoniobacterales bacterium]